MKRWHNSAVRHYLADPPEPDDDPELLRITLPLVAETIHGEVVNRNRSSKLATWTRRKHLQYLRKMFGYIVQKNFLPSNPIDGIKIPPPPKKPENLIYSREEVVAIIRQAEDAARSSHWPDQRIAYGQFALLVRFLDGTAARIGEVLKLRWEDVSASGIKILGKGNVVRHFPLEPFPEVRAVLKDIREYREINRGKLFLWKYP